MVIREFSALTTMPPASPRVVLYNILVMIFFLMCYVGLEQAGEKLSHELNSCPHVKINLTEHLEVEKTDYFYIDFVYGEIMTKRIFCIYKYLNWETVGFCLFLNSLQTKNEF